MHADRTNRAMLLLLAVLLLVAGAAGVLTSLGTFGSKIQHESLLHNGIGTFFGAHGDWLWPIIAVVAALVALLALRWLRALLFSTDRAGDLTFPTGNAGRTTMSGGALTDAVVEEIKSYRGVSTARARLIGDEADPELVVTATLHDTADFAAVRKKIEVGALTHARAALDNPTLTTQLDLTVTTKRSTRVA